MATSFGVDLVLRTQGGGKLRELSNQLQGLDKKGKGAQQSLDGTARGLNNTSRAAATATGNIQRMGVAFRSTLGPIVAAYGAVNFLTRSLKIAGDREADVAVLTNGLEKLGQTKSKVDDLVKAADRLGKVTLFNQDDFTQAFGLLTSFRGIAVSSYERVAEAAADVAQVTRQDVSSSMLQLAKALENPVEGMTALSRSGTTFTKQQKEVVKQLVETNRVAEAQEFILSEVEKQYKGSAAAAGKAGFAGKVDELGESFTDLSEIIGKTFAPVLDNIVEDITEMVNTFVRGLQAMERAYKGFMQRLRSTTVTGLTSDIAGLDQRIANQQAQLGKVNEAAPGGVGQAKRFRETITQLRNLRSELQADLGRLQGFDTFTPEPIKFKASGGDNGVPDPEKIKKSANSGKDLAKALQDSLKAGSELSRQFSRQIELRRATSELERQLLQIGYDRQDRDEQISELKDADQKATAKLLSDELARLDVAKALTDAYYQQADAAGILSAKLQSFSGDTALNPFADGLDLGGQNKMQLEIQQMEEGLTQLLDPINQVKLAATTIGDAFGSSFKSVLDGTKTAQEAISDFFKSIGDALLQYAAMAIAQYIAIGIARLFAGVGGGGGGIPGADGFGAASQNLNLGSSGFASGLQLFAEGGYVTGPTNALIGEAGESEYVIPSSKMGAAMANYRAGRRGDSVVSDSAMGSDAEDGGNNTFTLETVVINKVEYATVAQVREMGAVAAKQGAQGGYAKTMGSMRNSRSTRARIGMG